MCCYAFSLQKYKKCALLWLKKEKKYLLDRKRTLLHTPMPFFLYL